MKPQIKPVTKKDKTDSERMACVYRNANRVLSQGRTAAIALASRGDTA